MVASILIYLFIYLFIFYLKVFVCGVVFCCHSQLQETAKISCVGQQPLSEPRCLPLPLLRSLSSDRQREWWEAIYNLIHKQALYVYSDLHVSTMKAQGILSIFG